MKSYFQESEVSFGKYAGLTLQDIVKIDSDYINWCLINIDWFYIGYVTRIELKRDNPSFKLSSKAERVAEEKDESHDEAFKLECWD